MTSELPLRIRVDIRDLWESSKSDVQVSIASLQKALGHRIEPIIQWPIFWDELKDRFTDKATFVPSIARIVNAWYSRLLWRLDSGNFPEWTEELLGHLSNGKKQLIIEPFPPPHTRPKTTWNFKTSSFYLGIPKLEPPQHSKIVAALDQDFDDLLNQRVPGPANEGWDDLAAEPSRSGAPEPRRAATMHSVNDSPAVNQRPKVDRLPGLGELPRPNELFTTTSPYILTLDMNNIKPLDMSHGNPLIIRCSHEPTLEILSSYFNRWGKQNVNEGLRVALVESAFCHGMKDTLIVEPFTGKHRCTFINPTLLLAFIEGILGYKMVHTNGHNWVYRSDTIFK